MAFRGFQEEELDRNKGTERGSIEDGSKD